MLKLKRGTELQSEKVRLRPFSFFEFVSLFGLIAICVTPVILQVVPSSQVIEPFLNIGAVRHVELFKITYNYLLDNNRSEDAKLFSLGANLVSGIFLIQLIGCTFAALFEPKKFVPAINFTPGSFSLFLMWCCLAIANLWFPNYLIQNSLWQIPLLSSNIRFAFYAAFAFPFCALSYWIALKFTNSRSL